MPSLARRSQLGVANAAHPASGFRAVHVAEELEVHPGQPDLEPAISTITERAQHLTRGAGAAIALLMVTKSSAGPAAGRTASVPSWFRRCAGTVAPWEVFVPRRERGISERDSLRSVGGGFEDG